jgi:hypothetical protein
MLLEIGKVLRVWQLPELLPFPRARWPMEEPADAISDAPRVSGQSGWVPPAWVPPYKASHGGMDGLGKRGIVL